MTDTTENITFTQLRWRAVKIKFPIYFYFVEKCVNIYVLFCVHLLSSHKKPVTVYYKSVAGVITRVKLTWYLTIGDII